MNDKVRTSISRLIDDMSTPQDDVESSNAMWKPSATKLAEMELKYASTEPSSLKDSCRPWNYQDYLDRLATFRDSSRWFAKPAGLSPLQCARLGWSCDTSRRDGLICLCCKATLVHDNNGDPKGEALQAQLASGHTKGCGWGFSGPDSNPDHTPTACAPSFTDVPGVQSASKLGEQVVSRVNSLLAMMLAAAVSSAHTSAEVSIALRVLIPEQGASRSVLLPLDLSEADLAALKTHFQELEGRLTTSTSTARSGSSRNAWKCCTGVELMRSALNWLLNSSSADGNSESGTGSSGRSGSSDDKSAQLVRALLAIALSGWTASSSAQNARAVCCHLCGRAVSLSSADLEPLSQHRYFCPIVNHQSEVPLWYAMSTESQCYGQGQGQGQGKTAGERKAGDGKGGQALGWQCTLRAAAATFLGATDPARERQQDKGLLTDATQGATEGAQGAQDTNNPALKHPRSVDSTEGTTSSLLAAVGDVALPGASATSVGSVGSEEDPEVSPEQAYKRIRTVLALAAASRM